VNLKITFITRNKRKAKQACWLVAPCCLNIFLFSVVSLAGAFDQWYVYHWWQAQGHLVVSEVIWECRCFNNSVLKTLISLLELF
jgi:hypothetical protein